ncbi:MAG: hypothetical protein HY689_07335 [Chloroflexi bacterium]|nr:hypothetical protein [Chloroflexota bacterium]
MRSGIVTKVISGDTVALDNGYTIVRYSNVWADQVPDALAAELRQLNERLVLGKEIRYTPSGHIHFDNISIVAEVYLGTTWINQALRYWLSEKLPRFSPVLNQEGGSAGQP